MRKSIKGAITTTTDAWLLIMMQVMHFLIVNIPSSLKLYDLRIDSTKISFWGFLFFIFMLQYRSAISSFDVLWLISVYRELGRVGTKGQLSDFGKVSAMLLQVMLPIYIIDIFSHNYTWDVVVVKYDGQSMNLNKWKVLTVDVVFNIKSKH